MVLFLLNDYQNKVNIFINKKIIEMKAKLSLAAIVLAGFIIIASCGTTSSGTTSSGTTTTSPAYTSGQAFGSSLFGLYAQYKQSGKIDFNNINDEIVYEAFNVDGNEAEALNDSYLELFELIGRDAMLKLFKHFRGDKIDCPMRLYRPEFIADLAKHVTDRRERAKIARAGGYSARVIEGLLNKRRKENEAENGTE